jgi:hypothetical protein
MPIAILIPLLIQYGLPFVDKIFTLWTTNPNAVPTLDEWTALKALAQQTAKTQMLAALQRAGIDPASPQGVSLLNQVPA